MSLEKMAGKPKKRLVVFDVEGVLIPKNRFFFEVGKEFGIKKLIKILFFGFLYEAGIIKLESALKRIFSNLKGVRMETLLCIFNKIPYTPFLQNMVTQLKIRDCKIALISSGLPTFIVNNLASTIGADYAFGIEVGWKDEGLSGEIWGDAIGLNGKLKILNQILEIEELSFNDCIVIADDRNNRCIFLPQMVKIGYNPDFLIRVKADNVVVGKLFGILPIIDKKPSKHSLPSRSDLIREDIHASGFFVPVIAHLIGVPIVALLISIVSLLYIISELLRLEGRNLPLISAVTRLAASHSELHGFAAAPLYFALGILITLLIFPAPISGAAIAAFCFGDAAASIFGGLVSKSLPFNKGKTIEGSVAGFFFAFLAATFFVSAPLAVFAAAIAMLIEVLPLPVNDNVLVPVFTGLALRLFF